jgi:ribosomal-protein-alanine N-acetyltransferase
MILPHLQTERLILRLAEPADIPALVRFHTENTAHLAPTSPEPPPDFLTAEYWEREVARNHDDYAHERSIRLRLFLREAPHAVIGSFTLSTMVRGPAQFANVGFALDHAHQGQGIMTEAGHAVIAYAFGDVELHRLNACYLPTNARSARLFHRLGFVVEGYARDYLRIQGRWQDHVLVGLVNATWQSGRSG